MCMSGWVYQLVVGSMMAFIGEVGKRKRKADAIKTTFP